MAFTIEQVQRPTLVIAHNKTLAAQLCNEFREFFPKNAVEYFVSYYDYYQPEAYVPAQDLYIEKDSLDQRGDRPPAPLRHGRAVRPPRRDRRGQRLVHLRPRLAREVRRADAAPQARARWSTATRSCASSSTSSTRATTSALGARQLPRARRDARGLPRLRGDRLPRGASSATRSRRSSTSTRSPARSRASSSTSASGRRPTTPPTGPRSSAPVARSATSSRPRCAELEARGQAARVPPPAPAHPVRHGDAARARLLQRDRELLAHPRRPPARRRARTACSTSSPTTSSASSTSRTRPCRRSAACTRATARASRRSSTTASGCRARWTTGRRPSTSSSRITPQMVFVSATPGRVRAQPLDRGSSSRSCGPTGHHRPRGRGARDQEPDRRPDERDPRPDRARRAHAGHDPDQEDGRGPDRLPARVRLPGALPALGDRHARADPDHPRAAARRVRRAGRRQPAARGARPARGLAGRDPRRRQGGLPARRDLADPDDRPRRPQHRGQGDHVRRQGDRRDARRRSRETDRRRAIQVAYNEEHGITPETIRRASRTSPTSCADGVRRCRSQAPARGARRPRRA